MYKEAVVEGGMLQEDYREIMYFFFFQAKDGIRDLVRSRGLGDVFKRQALEMLERAAIPA